MAPEAEKVDTNWLLLFGAWLLACSATLGSLFFSEVMDFAPCMLCWYQRISIYPLVLILGLALFPFDGRVLRYALPLAIAGWLVALYHTLLDVGIIPESAAPCSQGVSCTEDYIKLLGFLSIPMLSLLGFSTMLACLLALQVRLKS